MSELNVSVDLYSNKEYTAYMKSIQKKQYTIRNLPRQLDERLRRRTQESGKSLNEVVLDVLCSGVGLSEEPLLHRDLDRLIGSWESDPEFEEVIQMQDQVDTKLWS